MQIPDLRPEPFQPTPLPGRRRSWVRLLALVVGLVLMSSLPSEAKKKKKRRIEDFDEQIAMLATEYRQWVRDVELLITVEELEAFLELEEDYKRDAFIERFWRFRDTYPDTGRNEFKDGWYARLEEAYLLFGGDPRDERLEVFMHAGPPSELIQVVCTELWPVQVWIYNRDASERVRSEHALIFFQYWGKGPFHIWRPDEGAHRLIKNAASIDTSAAALLRLVYKQCFKGDELAALFNWVIQRARLDYDYILQDVTEKPEGPSGEWVATFESYSTDVPDDAAALPGELEISYPGRHQSRTLLEASVVIPKEAAGTADLAGHRSYNFLITGEILRGETLFESFRYKFDLPANEVSAEQIPLTFERRLRPGSYEILLKVEDLNGGSYFGERRPIDVPGVGEIPPPDPSDPESARLYEEAAAAVLAEVPTVRLIRPHQEIVTGLIRFDTLVTGKGIDEVVFKLDEKPILQKQSPPYSVELDLGHLPRNRILRVEALGVDGQLLDDDEVVLNAGSHRFAVRIKEPRPDKHYETDLTVEADIAVPEGRTLERVEMYLDETRVATLYQEPWVQRIRLPQPGMVGYVRAIAYLPDGNSTEDTAFVNAGFAEDVEIDYVELYTTVVDREGRPVQGLAREMFTIQEDGQPQEMIRFETLSDLPIHVIGLLDVSASMEDRIDQSRSAALAFFEEAIEEKDRAAVITFNDRPQLTVKMTSELEQLGGGLAGLKAERGTALYDALIFSLYYFNGIKGQRALLLLSDGKDESSKFSFEDALEYSRRSGVAIYSIGLDLQKREGDARRKLKKLSEETGGRSFFIETVEELDVVYHQIEQELRSRYLLTYQSNNTSGDERFRQVEVDLTRSGLEAKTLRGYYP